MLALNLGFFSIIVGLGLAVYVIIARFSKWVTRVPGWASTVIILIFFSGVQLFTIGVLGQYLGSIFDEVKHRPECIVETKIKLDDVDYKIK